MKNYKCECCGAPLHIKRGSLGNNLICEYCGNEYEVDNQDNVIKIETFQRPVTTLNFAQVIPNEVIIQLGEGSAADIFKREMARQIADTLLNRDIIDFETEYEPIMNSQVLKAKLRVVNRGYLFE